MGSTATKIPRVRTVEYEHGWGWIARDPNTGKEVIDGFRWASRSVARDVVRQAKQPPKASQVRCLRDEKFDQNMQEPCSAGQCQWPHCYQPPKGED